MTTLLPPLYHPFDRNLASTKRYASLTNGRKAGIHDLLQPNYVEEGHKGLDNKAIRGGMDELQVRIDTGDTTRSHNFNVYNCRHGIGSMARLLNSLTNSPELSNGV